MQKKFAGLNAKTTSFSRLRVERYVLHRVLFVGDILISRRNAQQRLKWLIPKAEAQHVLTLFFRISCLFVILMIICGVGLDWSIEAKSPTSPDPAAGKIIPWQPTGKNAVKKTYYITASEKNEDDSLTTLLFVSIILVSITGYLDWQRKLKA